ncbi:hypothetical protein MP638_004537 [Amoeboaphelidium occidentale]|nr:hypothetical protein MP638_004537 [Amoeboaphelidium occidentale]
MYTLLTGLYKHLARKEEYNVLVLGLDNAGKTTLLEKIKSLYLGVPGLPPDKITPTIGLNIGKLDIGHSRLQIWDLGGQTDLQKIWNEYYDSCHAIMFVIDSCDVSRIAEVLQVFENVISSSSTEGVPVIMLANKQDIVDKALRVEQIKEAFNPLAAKLDARDSKVMPVSALTGDGVKGAVEWLHSRLLLNRDNRPPTYR